MDIKIGVKAFVMEEEYEQALKLLNNFEEKLMKKTKDEISFIDLFFLYYHLAYCNYCLKNIDDFNKYITMLYLMFKNNKELKVLYKYDYEKVVILYNELKEILLE